MTDPRANLWWADAAPRPSLTGTVNADVAIVGAGFTGLWTAYHLLRCDRPLTVVLIEAKSVGWGASGRNGGWCSALYPQPWTRVVTDAGASRARHLHRALVDTVDAVGQITTDEGIDCRWARGGTVTVASSLAHVARLRDDVDYLDRLNGDQNDVRWLSPAEMADHVRPHRQFGGTFTPHCAALDPGRLVRGLAHAVERRGGLIFEGSPAIRVSSQGVHTRKGLVSAPVVLTCTEAYGDAERRSIPLYSLVTATAPLPASAWDDIGLANRETLSDGRHLLIYAQRTADGRLVWGGRGAPYHFGSRVKDRFDSSPRTYRRLEQAMHDLFPATRSVPITHRWGGALAVPRDWSPSVRFDPATGRGFAGGYAGDGVALSALAGRALAHAVLGIDDDTSDLPFVNHTPPRWEREPLRWMGINAVSRLAAAADRLESATHRPARRITAIMTGLGGL